jgi:hypothetical protein
MGMAANTWPVLSATCANCLDFPSGKALRRHMINDPLHQQRLQLVAQRAETMLNRLDMLNARLVQLGLPAETSVTKARAALKKLHINIFDLVAGNNRKFRSVQALRAFTIKNKMFFPLQQAKADGQLRPFLRKILH